MHNKGSNDKNEGCPDLILKIDIRADQGIF